MTGRPEGLRVRLSRVRGLTAKGLLTKPLYLPVVMGPFTVSEEAAHREYETHSAGQFSVPAQGPATARMLRDLGDLETMALDWQAPWLIEWRDPQEVKRELNGILRSRTPVELLAILRLGGGPEEVRMLVTLRRNQVELRPGEADTRYWTVSVKEYRRTEAERRTADARKDKLPTRHKLTATDTLESLATKYHHTRSTWRDIANGNGLRSWGARTPIVNSSQFKVGDYIKIPQVIDTLTAAKGSSHGSSLSI